MSESSRTASRVQVEQARSAGVSSEKIRLPSKNAFNAFSSEVARVLGGRWAFVIAVLVVIIWGALGPLFNYSENWQLVINTGTSVVTFLMVFLIQNTQNRDSAAVHLKLDELIRTVAGAHNALLDLEELTENDLERLRLRYESLGRTARAELLRGIRAPTAPMCQIRQG